MAHFAQLDENNIVTQVIVVSNRDCSDSNGVESENIGVAFCQKLFGSDTNWKQTSYNDNMRARYAGIGMKYDATTDAFIYQQPYASWTLNSETTLWEAPITQPTLTAEQLSAGSSYSWDESAYQADNTTGWVLNTPE